MAAQRTSFDKLQRDRAKKAKQAAKRERKLSGEKRQSAFEDGEEVTATEVGEGGELDAATLLKLIEDIHKDLEDERITFEEFEEKKLELMARLPID
jgi:hypothetical protein